MSSVSPETVWTATGHERPVFLDEHGRRRRWVLAGGALGGGASALWLGALVAGAIGFSSMPSLSARTSSLIASRANSRSASYVRRHRHAQRRLPGAAPTELAVSRALISER
jgi:hypothetical protein